MAQYSESYQNDFYTTDASLDARSTFLKKTYAHVLGAVMLMVGMISLICSVEPLRDGLMSVAAQAWWVILVGFMVISFVAQKMAYSQTSRGVQYAGLGLYVLAQSLILTPIVYIAGMQFGSELLLQAAGLTLLVFGGLTAVVFITGANFNFLRGFLTIAGFAVMGLIAVSLIFGMNLGTWFTVGMILLLSMTILYETSAIRDEFPPDAYVAASLALFGSISTLFFYILRLLMAFSQD